jgi:hypothetical protein
VDLWTNLCICHNLITEESQDGQPTAYQVPHPRKFAYQDFLKAPHCLPPKPHKRPHVLRRSLPALQGLCWGRGEGVCQTDWQRRSGVCLEAGLQNIAATETGVEGGSPGRTPLCLPSLCLDLG